MTGSRPNFNRLKLEQAITAQEGLRGVVDDAIVDVTVDALKKQLDELKSIQQPELQRKQVTVLFMDTVRSTEITRSLDPEINLEIMDTALKRLISVIEQYGGKVIKTMGDGFLAVFGVPVARENDPDMAIKAGLGVLSVAQDYAHELESQWGLPDYQVRVGINTGLVAVGGGEGTEQLSGATVNLAERIEKATLPGTLFISHTTYQHIRGAFDLEQQEPIEAKGFPEPIPVYRVMRAKQRSFRTRRHGVEGVETRMIGREVELKTLQVAFDKVTEKLEPEIVTIVGEAGLGKSRLLFEFENWVDLQPSAATLYHGRGRLETSALPYGLVRDVFAFRFNIQDDDSVSTVQEKVVIGFEQVMGAGGETEVKAHFVGNLMGYDYSSSPHVRLVSNEPQRVRDLGRTYLTDYFQAAVNQSPVLMLLEDLHWVDDSSLDVLSRLILALRDKSLFMVGTTRPLLFERRSIWFDNRDFHTRITLKPLSKSNSRRLLNEVLQRVERVPEALRELVVGNAEGNPLYVEELVKMLVEDGVIIKEIAHWRVLPEQLADARVPPTLIGILQARLDGLPEQERTILQQASVVGRSFWDRIVNHLNQEGDGRLAEIEVLEGLASLEDKEMVYSREPSAFTDANEYFFKHAILRDVTYESVLLRQRKEYHYLVAQWIITNSGKRVGEFTGIIADHLEQAGQANDAVKYLLRAAEKATQIFAVGEALRFYDKAIELVTRQANDIEEISLIQLHEKRGLVRAQAGEFTGAEKDLLLVLSAADVEDDLSKRRDLLINLGMVYRRIDQYEKANLYLNQALSTARAHGDKRSVADSLFHLGSVNWSEGENRESSDLSQEAVDICEELGITDLIAVQAMHGRGECYFQAGDGPGASYYYTKSLNLARQIGDKSYEAENLYMLCAINTGLILADYGSAERYGSEAMTIIEAAQMDWHRVAACFNFGYGVGASGDYVRGIDYIRQGLNFADQVGIQYQKSVAFDLLGVLYQELGLLDEARDAHEQGMEIALSANSGNWLPRIQANLAIDHLRAGDLNVEFELFAAHEAASQRGQELHLARILEALAELFWATQQYEMTIDYGGRLLTLAASLSMNESHAQALRLSALGLIGLKRFEKAKGELGKGLELANKINRPRLLWDLHDAFNYFYRIKGDIEAASFHQQKVSKIVSGIAAGLEDDALKQGLPK